MTRAATRHAPIDLVMRRSVDQGETWEPLVVIESGFRAERRDCSISPTLRRSLMRQPASSSCSMASGRILRRSTVAHGQDPNSAEGNHVVWVRSTSDHGRTWSDREQVVYPDEPGETEDGLYWRQAEPGPGERDPASLAGFLAANRNDRLVIPAKRSGSETPAGPAIVTPFVYYSDDHGGSWRCR